MLKMQRKVSQVSYTRFSFAFIFSRKVKETEDAQLQLRWRGQLLFWGLNTGIQDFGDFGSESKDIKDFKDIKF